MILHFVQIPRSPAIVIKTGSPRDAIRRIAFFGDPTRVKSGFSGSAGPVMLTVKDDTTEIRLKHDPTAVPRVSRVTELRGIVQWLDSIRVLAPDIIGLINEMKREGALEAELYWTM